MKGVFVSSRVDIPAVSLLVLVEKATVMKRIEETVIFLSFVLVVVVVVVIEKASTMKGLEEAISATKMVRIIVVVFVAKIPETAKKVRKVEMKSTPTAEGGVTAATT